MSTVSYKSASRIFLCAFMTSIVCFAAAAQSAGPSLASADAAIQAGRFLDAAQEYEAWLKDHPQSKEVLLALGMCYVQLGRQNEAVATLRSYLKFSPRSAAGHAALGIALLDGADTAQAKVELETAVRLNSKQTDALEALARVYLIEGNADRAISLLQSLLALRATDETRTLLGDALIKAGKSREAGVLLERQLQANPSSASQMYAMTAWAYLKSGDMAKAAEICERGMRIYPDSEIEAVYVSLPAPFLAERIGARIKLLQDRPDVPELIAVGRVLIVADPGRKTRANEIAQRLLTHAIELEPANSSAHYNYGRALSQTSTEHALAEWEKALALNPNDELRLQILISAGRAKVELSDTAGAEHAFQEALKINRRLPSRKPEALMEYVRFLQLRSRMDEAAALLNEILSWNPFSPHAHLEKAKLLAARGQWVKAVEEGEFVLQNAENDQELLRATHALLVRAYQRLNQPEKVQRHRAWLESH
jgi:tetratricopeptide (TPR) repeat protein